MTHPSLLFASYQAEISFDLNISIITLPGIGVAGKLVVAQISEELVILMVGIIGHEEPLLTLVNWSEIKIEVQASTRSVTMSLINWTASGTLLRTNAGIQNSHPSVLLRLAFDEQAAFWAFAYLMVKPSSAAFARDLAFSLENQHHIAKMFEFFKDDHGQEFPVGEATIGVAENDAPPEYDGASSFDRARLNKGGKSDKERDDIEKKSTSIRPSSSNPTMPRATKPKKRIRFNYLFLRNNAKIAGMKNGKAMPKYIESRLRTSLFYQVARQFLDVDFEQRTLRITPHGRVILQQILHEVRKNETRRAHIQVIFSALQKKIGPLITNAHPGWHQQPTSSRQGEQCSLHSPAMVGPETQLTICGAELILGYMGARTPGNTRLGSQTSSTDEARKGGGNSSFSMSELHWDLSDWTITCSRPGTITNSHRRSICDRSSDANASYGGCLMKVATVSCQSNIDMLQRGIQLRPEVDKRGEARGGQNYGVKGAGGTE
ncbi:hypothetical protein C8R43DRAFT_950587 [Mycena crocata]|nr:hypothetical protein C8R43DRAFT_950587 [Mycena crocata]